MQNINLNNKLVSFDLIRNYSQFLPEFSSYENKVIEFFSNWINGKENFMIETSGSTGKPKQIVLNRAQMIKSALMTGKKLGLKKRDKAFICLSVDYIAGMMMIVRSFVLGLGMTVIDPCSNPFEKIDGNSVFDFTAMVPLQVHEIFDKTPEKKVIFDKMKAILIGGSSVGISLQNKISSIKASVYATYGMTETVTHIALKRLNGDGRDDFFKTLHGVEIGKDERGCLTIKSEITNGKLVVTNDLVEIIDENTFLLHGRIDNVINSGGIKIQSEKVEIAIEETIFENNIPERKFFVAPVEDEKFGNIVSVIFEGNPFSEQTENKIKESLKNKLTKYEIPKKFFYIQKIHLTSTDKIDKIRTLEFYKKSF